MIPRRRFLAISAAFAACPAGARAETWRGRAFGGEASVTLRGPDSAGAMAEVRALVARAEALFSLHDPASALSRLNARGALSPVPREFRALLAEADRVHRATDGLFDPTIQPLWRAFATGGDVGAARAALGWDRVRVDPGAVSLDPGQALSFNGIAQGFATDLVRDALRARGFTEVLVNIGEFAALGGPWRIGLEDPAHGVVGQRTLTDGAIATSSPGALMLGAQSHVIGPRGERPRWSTVSVEADRAALADALSTALCLAPRRDIEAAVARLPGVRRITLVDERGDVATLTGAG